MGEAIRKLFTSKRSIIVVLTALFNLALAIVLALGYSVDPEQAAAVWQPIIEAVALLVSSLAGVLVLSYGKRDPGQLPGALVVLFLLVSLSGCMHALRVPAEDHMIQAQTIADRCRTPIAVGGYTETPCSPELQADLDAMAKQARCITAITVAEKCE